MTLTPEKLAELREKVAALQASHYRMNAACFDSPLDAYIAAADPQTVLALVEEVERLRDIETDLLVCEADCRDLTEEVERLRKENGKMRERLHHPCAGCPGCSSNDCPDALDVATLDMADMRAEIERLRSTEATLVAIVRDLNAAREYGDSKLGLGGAYGAVVSMIGENESLRKALEEREADMHNRIRAGYDKTVADSWRAANERLQARVAELESAMAQRMGVYATPKDERQVGS